MALLTLRIYHLPHDVFCRKTIIWFRKNQSGWFVPKTCMPYSKANGYPFLRRRFERGPADHSHQASRRWYLPEENWWCGNWYQYSWTCFWKVPRPICFFKNEIVWMSPPSHGRLISLFRLLMQLFAQAAKDGKLGTPCEGSYQFRDTGFWDATYYGIVSSKHPDKSWWWHHHSKNGSVLQVSTGI